MLNVTWGKDFPLGELCKYWVPLLSSLSCGLIFIRLLMPYATNCLSCIWEIRSFALILCRLMELDGGVVVTTAILLRSSAPIIVDFALGENRFQIFLSLEVNFCHCLSTCLLAVEMFSDVCLNDIQIWVLIYLSIAGFWWLLDIKLQSILCCSW